MLQPQWAPFHCTALPAGRQEAFGKSYGWRCLQGPTLETQRVGGELSCLEACEQHARCVQWTYSSGSATCQLKEHFGDVMCSEDPGVFISGVLLGRFHCKRNGGG